MADTKTTVEMQAPPDWAIQLTKKVVDGFAEVDKRLDAIETNVDIQANTMRDLQQRVTAQDARLSAIDERVAKASLRVTQTSEADLSHESAIAEIRTEVRKLAERPDTGAQVLAAVDKLAEKPLVRRVGTVLVPVLMAAISLIGLQLQAKVSDLQAKQAPAQPPTIVVVSAPHADGGAP